MMKIEGSLSGYGCHVMNTRRIKKEIIDKPDEATERYSMLKSYIKIILLNSI